MVKQKTFINIRKNRSIEEICNLLISEIDSLIAVVEQNLESGSTEEYNQRKRHITDSIGMMRLFYERIERLTMENKHTRKI